MSLIKSSQVVHINSKFRQSGIDHDFTYNINLEKGNNFTHVAVIDISIPKSYYLIGENDTDFKIVERDINTEQITAQYTISMPIGNYSVTSFLYVLNNLFTGQTSHYSASFPNSKTEAQTGKITFTHSNTHHISEFVFGANHLAEIMGFERGSTNRFTIGQTNSVLISPNICNFQRESTIFLRSTCGQLADNDILVELFASGNPDLSNINFSNSGNLEEHSKKITNNASNNFRFFITDEFGDTINLNGIDMLITLLFYEKQNTDALIQSYIKYRLLRN